MEVKKNNAVLISVVISSVLTLAIVSTIPAHVDIAIGVIIFIWIVILLGIMYLLKRYYADIENKRVFREKINDRKVIIEERLKSLIIAEDNIKNRLKRRYGKLI